MKELSSSKMFKLFEIIQTLFTNLINCIFQFQNISFSSKQPSMIWDITFLRYNKEMEFCT